MTNSSLPNTEDRRADANARRSVAAERSGDLPYLSAKDNDDENRYPHSQPASFTKGLHHDDYGLVSKTHYAALREALVTGDRHMGGLSIAAGPDQRKWESPLAGNYFNDIGADSDAVAMAPAPKLGRSELCAEMATVYAMALTRDMSFEDLQDKNTVIPGLNTNGNLVKIQDLVEELRKLSWFDTAGSPVGYRGKSLTAHEKRRRQAAWESPHEGLTVNTLFRGSTNGAKQGSYLSQFMLLGTNDLTKAGGRGGDPLNGNISYGLQTTTQAQHVPEAGRDYMTDWQSWLEVQQGTAYDQPAHKVSRRIHTPRDLAGYVHFDALYQAYLNACLILLANAGEAASNVKVDLGNPIASARAVNSMGFATWGGPHILSLITEVATRGLRAARRTKFQVHRRARPEVIAARLAQVANDHHKGMDPSAVKQIENMLRELGFDPATKALRKGSILDWIQQSNLTTNGAGDGTSPLADDRNFLLPMAFIEGSPMHPAYGAGHATVAGACVTVLKAFFECEDKISQVIKGATALYTVDAKDKLKVSKHGNGADPTIAEELDKLAANISIGRNMAGVHYNSDYYDSLRMGERIAISILEEQMFTYDEPLSLSLTSFDGDLIELGTNGRAAPNSVRLRIADPAGKPVSRHDWWTRDVVDYDIVDEA
ncbi:phosphoesterase [Tateyamaria omphalii]|uniref:bromoperoxidase n=1 Tax=Tateyamaria omphalii TaxID=299262 RepID=UPI00167C43FF|nr:bromoperoxidase [Tateyamaria omphalii]GGX60948.1 phosphoesterase [Tateyamaria omphalii]